MNQPATPLIYSRSNHVPALDVGGRVVAALVASGCAILLNLSAWLTPSPYGVGTHTALKLQRCQFLERTGLPCPSCGMTTSFSWFARGNIAASLYVQPMGTVLAVLVAATLCISLYVAITGKPAHLLVHRIPSRYYLIYLPAMAILGWTWKIWIHVHGIDGWR